MGSCTAMTTRSPAKLPSLLAPSPACCAAATNILLLRLSQVDQGGQLCIAVDDLLLFAAAGVLETAARGHRAPALCYESQQGNNYHARRFLSPQIAQSWLIGAWLVPGSTGSSHRLYTPLHMTKRSTLPRNKLNNPCEPGATLKHVFLHGSAVNTSTRGLPGQTVPVVVLFETLEVLQGARCTFRRTLGHRA